MLQVANSKYFWEGGVEFNIYVPIVLDKRSMYFECLSSAYAALKAHETYLDEINITG